jgi:hypothetical protein
MLAHGKSSVEWKASLTDKSWRCSVKKSTLSPVARSKGDLNFLGGIVGKEGGIACKRLVAIEIFLEVTRITR